MSLSLTLYPCRSRNTKWDTWAFGIDHMTVEYDGWAHCVRASDDRVLIPETCEDGSPFALDIYDDTDGLIQVREDAHGDELTYMTANELLDLPLVTPEDREQVNLLTMTKAARGFLSILALDDPERPVILYFH